MPLKRKLETQTNKQLKCSRDSAKKKGGGTQVIKKRKWRGVGDEINIKNFKKFPRIAEHLISN